MSKEFGKYVRGGPPATEKFDMNMPPIKPKRYLMPIAWAGAFANQWMHGVKLRRVNMEGLKAPYILVCNHNAFFDFSIMIAAHRSRKAHIHASVDGFIAREMIMRKIGIIPKRKYTADANVIRQARDVLARGDIYVIYAEARYSLCGTLEIFPDSVGQLAKQMGVPVVTLQCLGHHLLDPFWGNHKLRKIKGLETFMTQILTAEEVQAAAPDEINEKIRQALQYDDFRWQSENKVRIARANRAQGLHKPLYQCPKCKKEYMMNSNGAKVFCEACGKSWTLSEYGELSADEGETEFTFPTDWYAWEREQVRGEVRAGKYKFDCAVDVNDLPNAEGFVHMGRGRLTHDLEGFRLEGVRDWDGEPFRMNIPAASMIAVHVEYDYRFGLARDCIDLNTLEDTWYCFPEGQPFSVTKVSIAQEEIFAYLREQKQNAAVEALTDVLDDFVRGAVPGIGPGSALGEDLGLMSMELFDLLCAIEARFGVSIPDELLTRRATLRDLAAYLETAANEGNL